MPAEHFVPTIAVSLVTKTAAAASAARPSRATIRRTSAVALWARPGATPVSDVHVLAHEPSRNCVLWAKVTFPAWATSTNAWPFPTSAGTDGARTPEEDSSVAAIR